MAEGKDIDAVIAWKDGNKYFYAAATAVWGEYDPTGPIEEALNWEEAEREGRAMARRLGVMFRIIF